MNNFIKTLKLLFHNFIYFIILVIGYDTFIIGSFKYYLFNNSQNFLKYLFLIIILFVVTYFFLIKTLKNKSRNSTILMLFLLLSIAFCISPTPMSQGFFPSVFGNKINFFFYDFSPTWVFINQGLYLISHIYQHNLDKNKII